MNTDHELLLEKMTLEEKVSLMTGRGIWDANPVDRLEIPALKVTDGPNGARGAGLLGTGIPALCIPCGSALGATWNPSLIEKLGQALAIETRARACHVLLAPTVNIHRTPLGGRNFECYSEDPYLTGRIAVSFIKGVQSEKVGTTIKHFVANDSEFERHSIDSQVPERALREIYLRPFEMAVKEAEPWGIMGSYNRVNGTYACENPRLLTEILREEWGFTGIVVTDWYAAKTTIEMAQAGLDLEMPGPGRFYGSRLVEAVQKGEVSEEIINEAVKRLLLLLERTNAFNEPLNRDEQMLDVEEHRELARTASTEAMVLLKNDNILPFKIEDISSLAVIGPNAAGAMLMGGGSASLVPQYEVTPLEALEARLADQCEIHYEIGAITDRSSRPVPQRLLTNTDGSNGFKVEYFNGVAWEGEPFAVHTGKSGRLLTPEDQSGADELGSFSFRATAQLHTEIDGDHTLTLIQAGRSRVLINGEIVLDGITEPPPQGEAFFGMGSIEIETLVSLSAGESVEVVVEFSSEKSVFLHGVQLGLRFPVTGDLIEQAVSTAAKCDAAIVIVGTNDDWETEGRDREFMELPGKQPELIRQVCAANPNTVVVVNSGSAVTTDWSDVAPAILQTWFGGQEMSHALADVLSGKEEPGGRLPNSWPHRLEDTPAFLNYPGEAGIVNYGEGIFVGYRWYQARDIEVAYPFGHGLGYTTFEWGEVTVSGAKTIEELEDGEKIFISFPITNVGNRLGSETAQCYVSPLGPVSLRPPQELKGFVKVKLQPGETVEALIELDYRSFAVFDPGDPGYESRNHRIPVAAGGHHIGHRSESGWFIDPGRFELKIGTSSEGILKVIPLDLSL